MQALEQIRQAEERGQQEVVKAEAEGQKIIAAARSKEDDIRQQISVDIEEKENILADQTLDEAKRSIAESKERATSNLRALEGLARENSPRAVEFVFSLIDNFSA